MIAPNNDEQTLLLTRGLHAIVDRCDFDYLCGFRWRAKRGANTWYAHTGHAPMKSLHGLVVMLMGLQVTPGKTIDHINGCGLDCRRGNLQIIAYLENSRKRINARAFPGVSPRRNSWRARIWHDGKRLERWFATELEAISQYRLWARELKGVEIW